MVNVDAHFDVRKLKQGKVHSGSPFRLMMEDTLFEQLSGEFIEFCAQSSQCSLEHTRYILDKNQKIVWLDEAKHEGIRKVFEDILDAKDSHIFVSFDLDAVKASDAPVSPIIY